MFVLNELRNDITNMHSLQKTYINNQSQIIHHKNDRNDRIQTHKQHSHRPYNAHHNKPINYHHRSASPTNNEFEYKINNNYLQIDDRLLANSGMRRPNSVRVLGDKSIKHKNKILTPLTPYNSGVTMESNHGDKINRKYNSKRKKSSNIN